MKVASYDVSMALSMGIDETFYNVDGSNAVLQDMMHWHAILACVTFCLKFGHNLFRDLMRPTFDASHVFVVNSYQIKLFVCFETFATKKLFLDKSIIAVSF